MKTLVQSFTIGSLLSQIYEVIYIVLLIHNMYLEIDPKHISLPL